MHLDLAYWTALDEQDWPFPDHVEPQRVADDLGELLCSADPRLRDDVAYTALARWSRDGRLDDVLERVGDAAVQRLNHPQVQARAFAPLALSLVVTRSTAAPGRLPVEAVERWCDAFARWYPAEDDTRGWDDDLGWVHAVAHGADAVGAFAARLPSRAPALLVLCAERMTAREVTYRYEQLEDARLARAMTTVLASPGLSAAEATRWLDVVEGAFVGAGPGAVPVWASNTFATLESLHLHLVRGLADEEPAPLAAAVAERVAQVLRGPFPWLG